MSDDVLVPTYLDDRDGGWIVPLIAEYQRFAGRPYRELKRRLQEPLTVYCPRTKLPFAIQALDEIFRPRVAFKRKDIADLRWLAYTVSQAERLDGGGRDPWSAAAGPRRQLLVEAVCKQLSRTPEEFESMLFADLPLERHVTGPAEEPSAGDVALAANLRVIRSILSKAKDVRVQLYGQVRPAIRQAKLRGLICRVEEGTDGDARMALSGPLALFHHTRLYGMALTEVVTFLAGCHRFRLEADVLTKAGSKRYLIRSGDPIVPRLPTRAFDSRIEQRFSKDFGKATDDYDLIREPKPITVGNELFFPDFAIKHRTGAEQEWLLEIVGFWTKAYLERKVALLNEAHLGRVILCVDRALSCSAEDWPASARIVSFRRRIDPTDVLRAIR